MKYRFGLVCLALAVLCAEQRAPAEAEASADIFALDTHIRITAYGAGAEQALEEAAAHIEAREALWSAALEDSEVSAINRTNGAQTGVSQDTAELIALSLELADATGGAFDPTIYPLVGAWGFPSREYRVPEAEEIQALLPLVNYANVRIEGNTVTLPAGAQIDLGGVAKGCIADELAALLRDAGVSAALINLGGNVRLVGAKPDGSDWRIGVKSPVNDGSLLGVLTLQDLCCVTSGAYERCFEQDGQTYGHILDPHTGYPAASGVLSVTVVGEDGALCDAFSTALFVMGAEAAYDFWRARRDFEMLLLTEDGTLYVTEGIRDRFAAADNELIERICVMI